MKRLRSKSIVLPNYNTGRCRVCRCTEDRACDGGCSWVRVEPDSYPLCSTCSGSDADTKEAIARSIRLLENVYESGHVQSILRAARERRRRHLVGLDRHLGGVAEFVASHARIGRKKQVHR